MYWLGLSLIFNIPWPIVLPVPTLYVHAFGTYVNMWTHFFDKRPTWNSSFDLTYSKKTSLQYIGYSKANILSLSGSLGIQAYRFVTRYQYRENYLDFCGVYRMGTYLDVDHVRVIDCLKKSLKWFTDDNFLALNKKVDIVPRSKLSQLLYCPIL